MKRLCIYFLVLPLIAGCSSFKKHHFKPEDTIVLNNGNDVFFLQNSLAAIGFDVLQTAYNYSKSDVLASVFFNFDKFDIGKDYIAKIDATARFFLENFDTQALVVGHCDHFGTSAYNNLLGRRRAESVKAKLIELGLDECRIITASVGSEQASEFCSDKAMTLVDRRADIVLFKPLPDTFKNLNAQSDSRVLAD